MSKITFMYLSYLVHCKAGEVQLWGSVIKLFKRMAADLTITKVNSQADFDSLTFPEVFRTLDLSPVTLIVHNFDMFDPLTSVASVSPTISPEQQT